jgi:hypothetical protein
MTAKEGYFGSDAKENRFLAIPSGKGKNEKYFMQVNKDTGRMEVWNEEFGQDRKVGFLDPGSNEFVPDKTFTKGARGFEKDFFSTDEGKKLIREQSKNTVIKEKIAEGKDITDARKEADELGKTNQEVQDDKTKNLITGEAKKATVAKQGTRKTFGDFVYPINLRENDQDVIKFTVLEYKPKEFKAKEGSLDFFKERGPLADRIPRGSVILPIPGTVTDTNACEWGEDSMNALEAALANIGLEFLTGTDLAGTLGKTASGIQKNKEDIKSALSTAVVSAATGSKGQSLLTRSTGNIMNPNMELLFKKPALRPFQFTFKLAPRSRAEAKRVVQIIRLFKQAMAPIKSASFLFLKSPHTFRLQYIHRNTSHPYLNRFKECALQNLSINYAPEGQYATYEDGVPTAYEMNMQFSELEPVFNDDYEISDEGNIESGSTLNFASQPGTSKEVPASIGF